ncbi:MAG: MBL fold metallo-hydrolase [Lacunisphaera sp.]|nr:MBL fold metallo-hydrolase [Lacunisphaera sp.]
MNRRDFLLKSGAAVSLGLFARSPLSAQATPATPAPAPTPVPVQPPTLVTKFTPLRGDVGYFTGRGGSIGWLASADALVAVDTQFPDTAAIFLKDLPGRNGRQLDAVINTHHHADHTGGNGVFKPATKTIVAQANVPDLMLAAAKRSPNMPAPTLPDATFATEWQHDFGREKISCRYFGPAHTSGDIVVHFEQANVVHLGDLLFNRLYPVVDRPAGARFKGWITRLEEIVKNYPADAIYVCGHGNAKFGVTGTHADILVFRDYIAALLAHVQNELKAGKPREEIVKLGNFPGFPDLHVPPGPGNRLAGNLGAAFDELTGG